MRIREINKVIRYKSMVQTNADTIKNLQDTAQDFLHNVVRHQQGQAARDLLLMCAAQFTMNLEVYLSSMSDPDGFYAKSRSRIAEEWRSSLHLVEERATQEAINTIESTTIQNEDSVPYEVEE